MSWLNTWFQNRIREAIAEYEDEQEAQITIREQPKTARSTTKRRWETVGSCDNEDSGQKLLTEPLHFRVYAATGGMVVETRFYDSQHDRTDTKMYLVPDGDELGKTLAHIVTMENLRR